MFELEFVSYSGTIYRMKKAVMTPTEDCDRYLLAMDNALANNKIVLLCQRVKT